MQLSQRLAVEDCLRQVNIAAAHRLIDGACHADFSRQNASHWIQGVSGLLNCGHRNGLYVRLDKKRSVSLQDPMGKRKLDIRADLSLRAAQDEILKF